MIKSFGDKETEKICNGYYSVKLPNAIQQRVRRKLRMINNSQNINDLRIPPSNHLEQLKGKLKHLYSIRINNQWRITFKWENNDGYMVKVTDDH